MTRDEAVALLASHRRELMDRGVAHAALFGSTARGDTKPGSDVDILIDLAADAPVGIYEFVALSRWIEGLFPVDVDLVERGSLAPTVRDAAERDLVHVF